jgi:RHS repeat-associated protein
MVKEITMKNIIYVLSLLTMLVFNTTSKAEIVYIHNDALGSPIMETNELGAVISRSHYKPLGGTAAGDKDDVGYTGHLNDTDLGLTYMQARYYDPVIGRFYSNDPVDVLGHIGHGNSVHGFNRYTYANNNPYKYVDPDGELGVLVTSFLAGALNAGIEYATNDNASGKDLLVAFGKGAVMGATGAGAINLMNKTMRLVTAASKAEKVTASAIAGSSVTLATSMTVDIATNATGLTDISALDSITNGIANSFGVGTGATVINTAKGLVKDSVLGTAGEVAAAGTAKVAEDKLKDVVD